MTPNSEFYRIDTTLTTPQVDPTTWRLRVHGMVNKELTLTYEDLLNRPMRERDITMIYVQRSGSAIWNSPPLAPSTRTG